MLSSKCAEGMENYCMKLSIIFVWQNEFASSVTDIAIHPNDQRRKENDFLTFFFFLCCCVAGAGHFIEI